MNVWHCHAVFAAILLVLMPAAPALAGAMTPKPDPEKGRALAERVCVACHVVSRPATSTVAADVPSFLAIANKQGQSMEAIAGRIVIPHPPMPAVALSREEIANVVAYIMTLKDAAAP
ncbi:cytochrome c [Hyphomicrobium sp.]|uniref:c-type cytochrome n=1 Tax=Hyphomicrobium sp. TaxID=82 RepID=UPI0025B99CC5|nr:cytochrome c [Hyphomicrobium sp.]MCC7252723.1 cytochrome c [Hyphomicrobium sp.]